MIGIARYKREAGLLKMRVFVKICSSNWAAIRRKVLLSYNFMSHLLEIMMPNFMQVGGVVNPPDCMEVAEPSTVTRLGDVCVTPFANNW